MYSPALKESRLNYSVERVDRVASEYQIQSLRTQILDLEARISNLTAENDRLSLDLRDRYNDVQTWRNHCQALEKNSNAAIQELAEKIERQKRLELEEILSKNNTKYSLDISGVENQNRLLQTRLGEYETKVTLLNEEIKRLTQINLDRTAELDQWKVKYANFETNMQARLDELRLTVDIRTRDEMESVANDWNTKFLNERAKYETQIKTLRQSILDLENRLKLAAAEAERYNSVLAEKEYQIEVLKSKFANYERFKAEETQNLISQIEEEKRQLIEKELKSQAIRFADERTRYEMRMKEIGQHLTDLENQMTYLSVELERLQSLLDEKNRENEALKKQYSQFEETKVAEIKNLHQHYENLRRNALQAADMDVRFQAERSALEAEIMQHRQKINELEIQVRNIVQENQRVSDDYDQLNKETESLRLQLKNRSDTPSEDVDVLRKENERLKVFSLEAHELKLRFDVEKQNYETQIMQLKQLVQVNKAEIENLYDLVSARRQENLHLNKQLNEARTEITRLETLAKEFEGKYLILEKKFEQVGKESQHLARSRDTLKSQIERGNVELSQKNRELLDKIREVDMLKAKYEDALSNLKVNARI